MPDKPVVAAKQPMVLTLDPGTYYWCRCGRSANQPFCDGAHQGTDLVPLELTLSEKKKVVFCMCKQTARPPHCDGSHTRL